MCEICELKSKINKIYYKSGLLIKVLDNAMEYIYCECETLGKDNKRCGNKYCENCYCCRNCGEPKKDEEECCD